MMIRRISLLLYTQAGKKSLYLLALPLLFSFLSCNGIKNRQQRIMNNIVYDLLPYKSADPKACVFKLVLSEQVQKGNIANWFKPRNYNKLLYYINQQINADFELKQNNRAFAPVIVYFEPNTKIMNKLVLLVAFENITLKEDTFFEFDDNLFNNGIIKFSINNNFNS